MTRRGVEYVFDENTFTVIGHAKVLVHLVFFFLLKFLGRPSKSAVLVALLLPFLSELFFAVGHHLAREWHIVMLAPWRPSEQMP